MFVRDGSYLFPSVIAHSAFFAVLTSVPMAPESSPLLEAVEYIVITDVGGGRVGADEQIGDAVEPSEPPERKFRQVKPKPKPVRSAPIVEQSKMPKPDKKPTDMSEGEAEHAADATGDERANNPPSRSMVMGSAGTNPYATAAGSGSGMEGIDRRSALRAWLRELQREVNKLASPTIHARLCGWGSKGSSASASPLAPTATFSVFGYCHRQAILRSTIPPRSRSWRFVFPHRPRSSGGASARSRFRSATACGKRRSYPVEQIRTAAFPTKAQGSRHYGVILRRRH